MTEPTPPDVDEGDEGDEPRPAHGRPFVPEGFAPPPPPGTDDFWLEPLGAEHNDADYDAWTSSVEHIHATPGFERRRWPRPMTREENLRDLTMHARHFDLGQGFTYTVRDVSDGDVVGCVYIYPDGEDPAVDARVRSWVRQSRADWDGWLADTVRHWLASDWPFGVVAYR